MKILRAIISCLMIWIAIEVSAQGDTSQSRSYSISRYVTAAGIFNVPVGGFHSDDRYDGADDNSSSSELGGALGSGVRLLWFGGWWVDGGLTVSYNSARVIPADYTLPLYALRRWSLTLPVTGGWYTEILNGFGLGPQAGIELISNLSSSCRGLDRQYVISSTGMWRRWNVAALVGVEMGVANVRVDILAHIGLLSMEKHYSSLLAESKSILAQGSIGVKFLF